MLPEISCGKLGRVAREVKLRAEILHGSLKNVSKEIKVVSNEIKVVSKEIKGIPRGVVREAVNHGPIVGRALGGGVALYGAGARSPIEIGVGLGLYALSSVATIRRDKAKSAKQNSNR